MAYILEKQGRAWVRLPRPLHQALAEIHAEHPAGCPASTSQFAQFEPLLSGWNLARIKLSDSHIKDGRPPENVFDLNAFGLAWASNLPPLSRDKRTMPPLIPLADIIASLPDAIREWLLGDPPIEKLPGGLMFEALGVLLLNHRGDAYLPTRELELAAAEYRQREQGGRSFTPETYVDLDISTPLASFMIATSQSPGVDARKTAYDGRQLRPWAATAEGAGIILTVQDGDKTYYRMSHEMRALGIAVASGERDGFKLATLMPHRFKAWVANSLSPALRPPMYDRLPAVLGLARRKGKYDWKLTKAGEAVVPLLASLLRAEEGVTVPDDDLHVGDGVDIYLPDSPYQPLDQEFGEADLSVGVRLNIPPVLDLDGDNPWDILGEITGTTPDPAARAFADADGFTIEPATPGAADTLAALDSLIATAGDAQRIVQAPVPSNAELAAAKARREARHPVADLSLDDEFDI